MDTRLQWTWTRTRPADNLVVAGAASPYALTAEQAIELRAVLQGQRPSMRLRALYERFWRLRGEGPPVPVEASDQRELLPANIRAAEPVLAPAVCRMDRPDTASPLFSRVEIRRVCP